MKQRWTIGVVCGMVCACAALAFAAEQPASSSGSTSAATPSSSPTLSSTPTPQSPAVVGSITALDLKSSAPSLKLAAADGKIWTLGLDPKTTVIWQEGKISTLDQLSVGQRVQVRYTAKDGKEIAKSIQIAQAPKAAATAPAAAPATPTAAPASTSSN